MEEIISAAIELLQISAIWHDKCHYSGLEKGA
jgi:hypothetical protein